MGDTLRVGPRAASTPEGHERMSDTPNGPTLRRSIGLVPAVLSGTGVIIGAGIYALVGEAAATSGNAAWLGFLLSAVVATFTAISYARMSRLVPKDSPEFQYARVGLGFRPGFTAGALMVWADVVSVAAVALGFGGYAHALFGAPVALAALGLIAAMGFLTWFGIVESLALVTALSLVEIAGLVLVIAVGVPHWGDYSLLETAHGIPGIWTTAALVFFAYLGFDDLGNLAEEMRDPKRDLPAAFLWSLGISTVFYVLVAISAVSLVGWQVLSASGSPLADAVAGVLGERGRTALALIALASTGNTVLLLLVSASRSMYGMAQARALPGALGRVGRRRTPWLAVLVAWLFGSAFLLLGDLAVVAQVTNFTTLTAFALVNLSLAFYLWRRPQGRGARAIALLQPVAGALTCALLMVRTGWLAVVLGLLFGLVSLAAAQWASARQPAGTSSLVG